LTVGSPSPVAGARAHEFVEKAGAAATDWNRFADTKGVGILVLLGLGLSDLLEQIDVLHPRESTMQVIATCSFALAGFAGAATIIAVRSAILPRLGRRSDEPSRAEPRLFFFADIASWSSPKEFEAAMRQRSEDELFAELAAQTWRVAVFTRLKYRYLGRGYRAVVAFLAFWVLARTALALA
jgi:hypothetical protein